MVNKRRHDYDRAVIFAPTKARYMGAKEVISDFEYVPCEVPPNLEHGLVWAHSLGATPSNIFGELLAAIDHRIEQVKQHAKKQKGRR